MSAYKRVFECLLEARAEEPWDPREPGRRVRPKPNPRTAPKTSLKTTSSKVKEQVKSERPGVHSVSREDRDKWKKIKHKALTSPAVKARVANLIKSRRAQAKRTSSF